ncbi:MAG: ribonuclease H-like domain-containing protein [Lachnospiraceae bacterium]|nr:ribonuclease H-like domain-containing protein [Lachnospiraceae bacterium]
MSMQTIVKSSTIRDNSSLIAKVLPENAATFDIETTGFHKDRTSLYLIGLGRITGSDYEITQYFADTKEDEKAVLEAFLAYLKDNGIEILVSFNGLGFDVPYLSHKLEKYNLPSDLKSFTHLDIYKIVAAQKSLFRLDSYAQKSIEHFLGIGREDEFNGGQLIPIYEAYAASPNDELLKPLLLHNYEDVLGMLDLIPILSYFYDINGISFNTFSKKEVDGDILYLEFKLEHPVPKDIEFKNNTLALYFHNNIASIELPLYEGRAKLFYPDFKDYYYLPEEDYAIHKSVAEFMDKSRRVKATKNTAYSFVNGTFINSFGSTADKIFCKNKLSDDKLILLDDNLSLPSDFIFFLKEYIKLMK